MVDLQQIVYPPVESARRVKLLHHVELPVQEAVDPVPEPSANPSPRPRSSTSKLLRQRLKSKSSQWVNDDHKSIYKMDSRAALVVSKQLNKYNDDVLALRAKLSQKPSLSSSRFQFNDLQSAMDPEKESAAAHLMHLNRLINERSETTIGEPQTAGNAQTDYQQGTYDRRETTKHDPQSTGMQSYSMFPQTARGLSTNFPRPQSTKQLIHMNKDLNNLNPTRNVSTKAKSSLGSLKIKNHEVPKKKPAARYRSQQRLTFKRTKNLTEYTSEEYADFLRYLKSDNYYDGLFAGRLQNALNAELERKRQQILDTNEEDVKIKMKHPKQFNIRVKNIVLDEAPDGLTDAPKSPQAMMVLTQTKEQEYDEKSLKPRTENLSSKHASELKGTSELRKLELNQADQVKIEQVLQHPASPLSNVGSNELAKKTETTEAKDKNISIKDLINELEAQDHHLLRESAPGDNSSKS